MCYSKETFKENISLTSAALNLQSHLIGVFRELNLKPSQKISVKTECQHIFIGDTCPQFWCKDSTLSSLVSFL